MYVRASTASTSRPSRLRFKLTMSGPASLSGGIADPFLSLCGGPFRVTQLSAGQWGASG